jgi:hypothetical protein
MTLSFRPSFRRPYLAAAGLAAVVAGTLPQQLARAAAPFSSEPVEAERAIALAQPLSGDRWNLIVLEQLEPAPPCWRRFADGTVATYERNLPATTCGLYHSSSAYSLRVAGDDLRHPWRLRVENRGGELELLASSPEQSTPIRVGSGSVAGDGLVELKLAEGWGFERRLFEGRSLNHLYVANAEPLPVLLARAGNAPLLGQATPPPPVSALETATSLASANPARSRSTDSRPTSSRLARLESLGPGRSRDRSWSRIEGRDAGESGGVIALQVVPYQP